MIFNYENYIVLNRLHVIFDAKSYQVGFWWIFYQRQAHSLYQWVKAGCVSHIVRNNFVLIGPPNHSIGLFIDYIIVHRILFHCSIFMGPMDPWAPFKLAKLAFSELTLGTNQIVLKTKIMKWSSIWSNFLYKLFLDEMTLIKKFIFLLYVSVACDATSFLGGAKYNDIEII